MVDQDRDDVNAQPADDGTVITITAGPALLGLVLVVAVVGGFVFARNQANERQRVAASATASAAAAATQSAVANAPVVLDPSGIQFGGSTDPQERDPGTILPLDASSPLLGQPFIDVVGTSLDGQPMKVSDFAGKPIMLNFWATWCPPCRVEMPWMEEAYQTHKDAGFVIVAADAGERVAPEQVNATVQQFITNSGLTFGFLMPEDPYAAQIEYRVYGLPSTYLIDPAGSIVDAHRGMYPNKATLLDRVQKLMAGELSTS
jgi:thiol-disulfide isomerase/thioredoxin